MAATHDAIAILEEILTHRGPLRMEDLAQPLRDRGIDDPESTLQWNMLEMDCPVGQLVDDRWVWLPALLAGRVFTHRIASSESAHDLLTLEPDLTPITRLCEHDQYQRLADGSAVRIVLAGYDDEVLGKRNIPTEAIGSTAALLLTPGTLAGLGVTDGDTIGVRLTPTGLVLERVDVTAKSPGGDWLAAALDRDEPTDVDAAAWTACAADPELFAEPLPPLSQIAEECGLAYRGEWLAPGGFDFDSWQFEIRCELLAKRYDLDPDDALTLASLVALYARGARLLIEVADGDETTDTAANLEAHAADGSFGIVGKLGAQLADPLLAELLVAETIGSNRGGAAALGMFAETLESRVPRTAKVACRWLQAVALERLGDIAGAERELLAAESLDPDWPLPLIDLAHIASDRGDAERGLGLLRRAGVSPDFPLVELLEAHRSEARRDLGRNEPCWCGSGRKYKKCHLGREQLGLGERVQWLYAKAIQHVLTTDWRELLAEVGVERYRHTHDIAEAVDAGMADPLVMDAVLFEGGAFADFLEVRGTLLPEDERLLAEQWLLVDRSVFEIEQVRRGEGVDVRDVRTGETHEVAEQTASRTLKPGHLICTRVVPAGDSMQFFGGVEVLSLYERDRLIELLDAEPDPVELVSELSRKFAPPTLTNTEGDPMVICETRVGVDNPAALATALDDTYGRVEGDGPPRWHERVETHGMQHVRATLVLDGDVLRVETNSEQRMDRVLATLGRLDPTMRVFEDSRTPIQDARQAAELAGEIGVSGERARPCRSGGRRGAQCLHPRIRGQVARRIHSGAGRPHAAASRGRSDPTRRRDQTAGLFPGR